VTTLTARFARIHTPADDAAGIPRGGPQVKQATTAQPINPLLAARWSPRAFDGSSLSEAAVQSLLEAARWAPSAMNHQPWRFIIGRNHDGDTDRAFKNIYDALAEGNQIWAGDAPLLIAATVRTQEEDGTARTVGGFELGLATAQIIVQAHDLGLHAHVIGGFNGDQVRAAFDIPDDYQPLAVVAVGRVGTPDSLPERLAAAERAPRTRLRLAEIVYGEAWGEPAQVTEQI
jgi:nitroreductase